MINIFQYKKGLRILPEGSTGVSAMGELEVLSASGKLVFHNGTTASPVVTEAHAHTLTNKTIDADSNTITNIDNADIKSGAAIDAAKIHDGSVSNTEFGYLNGVTSAIQTQLNNITGSSVTSLTGDVTGTGPGATATTIANDAVSNAKLANMAQATIKGRASGAGTGDPTDLTGTQATAILDNFVGDSGSGGTKGLVPAPAAGDAAADKFLKANGTWTAVNIAGMVTETGTQTLTNKSLVDNSTFFIDESDATKKLQFQLSGITTGTTRTLTIPNISDTLITRTSTDQGANRLKNKDLEAGSTPFVDSVDTTKKIVFSAASNATGAITNIESVSSVTRSIVLPNADTTLVGHNATQTLTNKDLNGGTASADNKWAVPKNTKSNLDALARREANVVYATDQAKLYVDNGTTLLPVGSGGASGVNFVGLNTSFAFINSDDVDAENSVGNWAAYADAAGSSPVDMTGGSPNITITRTTTAGEVLNGSASFEVTKDAANRQGQGVSVVANIPLGYRGKPASIEIPLKIISGTLVSGDLKFYIYDVTNSQVITPFNNDIIYTSTLRMTWDVPSNCAQIRVGFHFASTSTTAVNFSFDDVKVGPQEVSFGPAMSDWVDESSKFTVTGAGTISNKKIYTKRQGDSLLVRGGFTCGTNTVTTASLNFSGYTIDTAKLPSIASGTKLGFSTSTGTSSGVSSIFSADFERVVFYDGSTSDKVFFSYQVGTTGYAKAIANVIWIDNEDVTFDFSIPISGWSTGVVTSNSSVFRISNVLANGTRVTGSAPTTLGQYRSYLRDASAFTFTETNGSPGTAPSAANGILLYGGNVFTSADTNNEPSRYEIFVGKNKYIKTEFYLNSGRTGYVNTDCFQYSGGRDSGVKVDYDPTTGIVNVQTFRYLTGVTANSVGTDSANADVQDCYFDIIVSENAQAVQQASIRSTVWVHSGAGTGSTNTTVREYTTIQENTGTAITYATSSADGGSFTINEDGLYEIMMSDAYTSGSQRHGPTVNSSGLTTSVVSLAVTQRPLGTIFPSVTNQAATLTGTLFLRKGDIVRGQRESSTNTLDADDSVFFRITKIAN